MRSRKVVIAISALVLGNLSSFIGISPDESHYINWFTQDYENFGPLWSIFPRFFGYLSYELFEILWRFSSCYLLILGFYNLSNRIWLSIGVFVLIPWLMLNWHITLRQNMATAFFFYFLGKRSNFYIPFSFLHISTMLSSAILAVSQSKRLKFISLAILVLSLVLLRNLDIFSSIEYKILFYLNQKSSNNYRIFFWLIWLGLIYKSHYRSIWLMAGLAMCTSFINPQVQRIAWPLIPYLLLHLNDTKLKTRFVLSALLVPFTSQLFYYV